MCIKIYWVNYIIRLFTVFSPEIQNQKKIVKKKTVIKNANENNQSLFRSIIATLIRYMY